MSVKNLNTFRFTPFQLLFKLFVIYIGFARKSSLIIALICGSASVIVLKRTYFPCVCVFNELKCLADMFKNDMIRCFSKRGNIGLDLACVLLREHMNIGGHVFLLAQR